MSCWRSLPTSPANGCSGCSSNSSKGRMADDAQEHFGDPRCGGRAKFVLYRLQGHKKPARERATEGPGGGPSETEWRNGKQSRNSDGCPRCVDERERGASGADKSRENEGPQQESFESKAPPALGLEDLGSFRIRT